MWNFISELISKPFIKQLIKFAFVGAIGTIVNLTILYILTEFFLTYYIISEIIAFIASTINNYILNKFWTFKEKLHEKLVKKYVKYIVISLVALIVNICILFILVEYFYLWYILAELLAICGAFMVNYMGNRIWTFKKKNIKTNL